MDVISYALSKKIAEHAVSGVQSMSVSGQTLTINTKDSGVLTMTFPKPRDGVSVTDIDVNANNQIVFTMSDGTEFISGKIPTVKGDKGDKLTFNDLTEAEKESLKGQDGFSPIAKVEKVGKVATITITDSAGTTTATVSDGEGSEGGEANVIDSISVNGVNVSPDENKNVDITVPSIDGLAKTEDIPTKVSELTNDSGYLTEHQDISGKVDKVDGKSLIADTEIERLASVDNYNDTQVKTQIQAVANGLMDSVGYSADYKTIDIIAKNSVKKSVDVAPIISHASITELSDVDTTNKATGKALVYNATTSKHEYADVSSTDEKVKMDASTDAKYLGELLDNVTIANENGKLKVKKLDGQEVTITEINYLKGLTMNVMDLVNMFSNGGVKIINTPVATYAELLTLDKSSFIEGVSYLVYVLADENHDNAKTTYLVDKDSETPTYFGFADSQRDFTTNPIDLATEITGKLGISNMDSDAIKALFTVDDTYKTETATNNAFSTHGAKALYDELLLAIGNKANDSDLTAHKDDTDIHVSTEDRTKWDSAKTHADSAHAPSNAQANVLETVKVNNQEITPDENKAVNIDLSDYAKTTDIPTTLPANGGNSDTVNNHTVKTDVPTDAVFTDTIYDDTEVKGSVDELNSNLVELSYSDNGIENLCNPNKIERGLYTSTDTRGENYFHYEIEVTPNEYYSRTRFDGLTDYSGYCFSVLDENKNCIVVFANNERTIQIPSNGAYLWLQGGESAEQLKNMKYMVVKLQTPPTDYKPYIPSVKMLAEEVGKQNESLACNASKNMLLVNVGTISGVTITSKDKSTALLNGTNTSNVGVFATADVIPSGEYHLKVSNRLGALYVWDSTHSKTIIEIDNTECNFTLTEPVKLTVGFSIGSGCSFTNFEVSGQLEKGTVATDFVPYNGKSNLELTNDVVSLKNDLNTLEFGEIAGGKNLFKGNFIEKVLDTGINYTDVKLIKEQNSIKDIKGIVFAVFGAYLKKGTYTFSYTNDAYFSLNRIAIAGTDCVLAIESIRKSYTWTQNTDGWTYFGIEGDDSETGVTDTPFSITPDIQIEKGAQATPYEPYIPSVKMIAEENAQQSSDLDGLGYGENGAKNLFKNYDVMKSYTISSETYNGYPIIYSDQKWEGAYQSDLILKSGVTYTLSAYIKGNGWAYVFSSSKDGYIGGKKIALTDNFERFSLVYTPNEDVSQIRIENDGSELYITCFQIEEGDTVTPYKPYIPSVKMLAEEVNAQNKSLSDLENAINGLNDDNYWEQGTWNILGQKVDEPTIIRMKEKLILPIDYSVSLVNSNYVYEVDYYENGAYKNDTDWISGSIVIPNGQEFVLLIRKVDNSSLVPTERNAISVLPKNIGIINAELKKDLGGLTFSASGTTLTITDGTNTWTLGANS